MHQTTVNFDKYKLLNMKLKGLVEKVHLIMQNFMWSGQVGTLGALKGPFSVTVEPLQSNILSNPTIL